ncbi:hypothetical protein A2707_05880 [Candidatus Saccharibacteria bacterium RIFCSPHIGHO2_01_FULL_45_15]|nr:MAG: hypothetical protein A2707_05880 [Candidatus Saccharibacteria bacterium RIFCSPHIGHO2_01_FULL_45_15]OGL28975.1 MAG: hypothetical protein A3C39_06100 [Candidatus Saccharibacteria bacterium RIFCSPHIGHO2_02_FULL_46_12]OGL31989.1 MAG: hypothetical protein A3E76_01825 [Candidatus Saccharibacteria bacterium RIFCSPHIGHO2_12_FULL_44_22]
MSQVNKTSQKTIQQKTIELHEIVAWFDSDEFTLEKAMDTFKKAEALAADIEHDLLSLKNDIQVIKQKFDTETSE